MKQKKEYLFDLTRFYRIWLSPEKDEFLGSENMQRMIRMRQTYPGMNIHLLFSSQCLTESAVHKLFEFCSEIKVVPVEFETLKESLVHEYDLALHELATQEIRQAISGKGGNLAAAADCIRLIASKYGIYSDFDLETDLFKLNKNILSNPAPFLLPASTQKISTFFALRFNSDFLAFSYDESNPEAMNPLALKCLRSLQEQVIKNYKSPFNLSCITTELDLSQPKYLLPAMLFREFANTYPLQDQNVFYFRIFLQTLKNPNLSEVVKLLTRACVINVSGPDVYPALFKSFLPKGLAHPPLFIPQQNPQWLLFEAIIKRCDIASYPEIQALIYNTNSLKATQNTALNTKPCDLSWLAHGRTEQKLRDKRIHDATVAIQKNIRMMQAQEKLRFWKNTPLLQNPNAEAKAYSAISELK